MNVPSHRNRTSEEILTEHAYHDSVGLAFRAASWLDYVQRTEQLSALRYACIDGRLAIEHLMFEQLVLTAGPDFTEDEYNRCLKDPRKLAKLLKQIVPDYDKLMEFTVIVASLEPLTVSFPPEAT